MSSPLDLLQFRPLARLVRARWFPLALQALLLAAFLALAFLAWGRFTPEGVPSKLYAKVNLVNLLLWGLWWPAMVFGAFWFGRSWCLLCPLELVSNLAERLARALGLPQQRLPRWIAAGGIVAVLYFSIQLWVAGAELHRVPAHTAVFLALLLAGALLSGLLWKHRAFCRGFCPVGLLLNVYGRGAVLALRPGSASVCRGCTGRDCKVDHRRDRLDARSCPSLLDPSKLDTNADCLLCLQCVKACPHDNLALRLRRPFDVGDRRERLASWPVTLFVMVLSGFVTAEVFSEWKEAQAWFLAPAERLSLLLDAKPAAGWIKGVYTLLFVPWLAWSAAGLVLRLSSSAATLDEAWRRLALPMAIVLAAGHMAKGLAKVVSWGSHLPLVWEEPMGVATARRLASKQQPPPVDWLSLGAVSLIGCALLALAAFWAFRELHRSNARGRGIEGLPVIALAGVYLFLVSGWSGIYR